ncbi:hypothetical protein ACOMHN_044895 [Nucella lapillus]
MPDSEGAEPPDMMQAVTLHLTEYVAPVAAAAAVASEGKCDYTTAAAAACCAAKCSVPCGRRAAPSDTDCQALYRRQ